MTEEFITVHYVMGFFLIVFAILIAFSFFTSLIRRVFDLLDEIIDLFEGSKDTEESDEN